MAAQKRRKITLEELKISQERFLDKYTELQSIEGVAKFFGIGKWMTRRLLDETGIPIKGLKFSLEERKKIKQAYSQDFKNGDTPVKELAIELGRCYHTIVREARKMGLTNRKRKCNMQIKIGMSERSKKWLSLNAHPRGMAGKPQSEKAKLAVSTSTKARWKNMTDDQRFLNRKMAIETWRKNGHDKKKHGNWKAGWREIGGKRVYFRSRWEANYGRFLEFLKQNGQIKEWEHEPQTFWFEKIKRGVRSYLPDFKVTKNDGTHYWVEVKGYMDKRSQTKIKRFLKYYPEEIIVIRDAQWFYSNSKKIGGLCPGWE